MKKLISIIFFAYFSFFLGYSQDSTVVKLNLTDCHNCYGGFCFVENLKESNPKVIVIKKADKKNINYFVKNILKLKNNYEIIVSDSIYNKLSSSLISEVFFYRDNQLIYKNDLGNLNLQKAGPDFILDTLFKLPDSISLSQVLRISNSKKYMAIKDFMFNAIVLIDPVEKRVLKYFNEKMYPMDYIYHRVDLDTTSRKLFENYKSSLVNTQNDVVLFGNCFFLQDRFIVGMSYPVLKKTIGDTVLVIRENALMNFSLSHNESMMFYKLENYRENSSQFYNLIGNVYPLQSDEFLIRAVSSNIKSSYMLNSWIFSDLNVIRKKTISNITPDFYIKTGLGTNMLSEIVVWPWIFYTLSSEVFNINTNKWCKLPFENDLFSFDFKKIENLKFNYQILSAFQGENMILLLVLEKESTLKIYFLDPNSLELKYYQTLPDHVLKNKITLDFYNEHILAGSDGTYVFRLQF